MAPPASHHHPLPQSPRPSSPGSLSSVSTTSLVFDRLQEESEKPSASTKAGHSSSSQHASRSRHRPSPAPDAGEDDDSYDAETGPFLASGPHPLIRRRPEKVNLRKLVYIGGLAFLAAWLVALAFFVIHGSYRNPSGSKHDSNASSPGSPKPIDLQQVLDGYWYPKAQSISWVTDPDGHDGLLLQRAVPGKDYLVVEDVRAGAGAGAAGPSPRDNHNNPPIHESRTLIKEGRFEYKDAIHHPEWLEPSPDLKKVLVAVVKMKLWRYSFMASYFILDVASGKYEPLLPHDASARVQRASWSPKSDAIAFTMNNNLYIRRLQGDNPIVQVTKDGGPDCFYGVPDWVYEEEVFGDGSATWWSPAGDIVAFLRTNDSAVGDFPIDYYMSRPSGHEPAEGREAYPEVRRIKYPKPGSPNPVAELKFYNLTAGGDVFTAPVENDLPDEDRIISHVMWAGDKVLYKATNRVGDELRTNLVDVGARKGKTIRTVKYGDLDGGWFEITHKMIHVPIDYELGRAHDGYIDVVIKDGYRHLAYLTPLDKPETLMLTSGAWEVADGPAAFDYVNNLVYFVAAKESPAQRHLYSVSLYGSDVKAITNTSDEAYYDVSLSSKAGFALLSYQGPGVPWQKLVSTPAWPAAPYERMVEENAELAEMTRQHSLPQLRYGSLDVGEDEHGLIKISYLERRPPHFDPRKKYPVLFHQYSGPDSQSVNKRFVVDYQSYVASALGYVVVTVDPRGTGFAGRRHRVAVRKRLGQLEAHDLVAAGRHFGSLPYVDADRLAIWGWSYGGFVALKTLEQDAGATFSYGMAVAPVTDWRFYNSFYAERYMGSLHDNEAAYEASSIANASALGLAKRFLLMHGTSDDNVHLQNSLALIDALDLAAVENYDMQLFPDSDHSIAFHKANRIVFDKLTNWLINAFNGQWLAIANPKPIDH